MAVDFSSLASVNPSCIALAPPMAPAARVSGDLSRTARGARPRRASRSYMPLAPGTQVSALRGAPC